MYLTFGVCLEDDFVPDNYFTSKLFKSIVVEIEHQELNQKSGENICSYTRYFTSKLNYADSYLTQFGELEGYWSSHNYNNAKIIADSEEVTLRRKNARMIKRTINGTEHTFYMYQFCLPLDTGLASLNKPIPKDATVVIRCMKDRADKALIATKQVEIDGTVSNTSVGAYAGNSKIELINPHLEVTFYQSDYFDSKLHNHKLRSMKWPFSYRYIMTYGLDTNLDTFEVRITHGEFE